VRERCALNAARAYHRVLALTRTIAAPAASERIEATHLAEALQCRPREGTWRDYRRSVAKR